MTQELTLQQKLYEWHTVSEKLDEYRYAEMKLRNELYVEFFPNATVGTNTKLLPEGGQLKAVRRLNYNITDEAALAQALQKIHDAHRETLVKWKPSINLSVYKLLSDADRELVNTALTITDATPSLEYVA